ncbi:MAG: flippase [Gammaproteobacteria bacterium]|nr:flippase [Gammaproteobacteria bacterium]
MRIPLISSVLAGGGHGAELFKGTSQAFVLRLVGMAVTYGFNFLVARLFGASAMGAFALATTVVTILGMLSRLGCDRAIVRFIASNASIGSIELAGEQYRLVLKLLAVLGLTMSLLMFFASNWIAAGIFDKPGLATVFRIASPAVLLFSLTLFNAEALRGLKKIKRFAAIRYVLIYLFAIPALFVFRSFLETSGVPVMAFTVACGFAAMISLRLAWRAFPAARSNVNVSLAAILTVSVPMLASNSMGMVISWTDVLMLGRFASEDQVGIYSIAMKLAFLTSVSLNAVNSISTPKFAEFHMSGDTGQLATVMRQTTKLLFYTSLPILFVLVAAGKPILVFFGAEFEAGYLALVTLVAGQFVSTISGPVGNLLQMNGLERQFLAIVGVCALVNVVMNIVLIPRFGILGAALASAFTLSLNNLTCVIVIYKKLGFVSLYLPFVDWFAKSRENRA